MANKDFIDDDLIQRRNTVKEVNLKVGRDIAPMSEIPKSESVPVKELNLTPLTKRKEEINSQMATRLDELERLRARQEALEKEKSTLEQLRNNQEKYESGRREMIDHLEKSMVAMEREDVILNQRLALLTDTAASFKEMLKELRAFNEETWPLDSVGLRDELNKALAVIDNIRKEYNRSCARMDAARELKSQETIAPHLLFNEAGIARGQQRGFLDWLKIGMAVSLPVIIMLIALIVVLLTRQIL
jgi:chromosome segregation ATPase